MPQQAFFFLTAQIARAVHDDGRERINFRIGDSTQQLARLHIGQFEIGDHAVEHALLELAQRLFTGRDGDDLDIDARNQFPRAFAVLREVLDHQHMFHAVAQFLFDAGEQFAQLLARNRFHHIADGAHLQRDSAAFLDRNHMHGNVPRARFVFQARQYG